MELYKEFRRLIGVRSNTKQTISMIQELKLETRGHARGQED